MNMQSVNAVNLGRFQYTDNKKIIEEDYMIELNMDYIESVTEYEVANKPYVRINLVSGAYIIMRSADYFLQIYPEIH
jgi:hypothetical protein